MRRIDAFETPDNKRFFDEGEARTHERRYAYSHQVGIAVRGNAQYAKLDLDLLVDFLMKYGPDIGKIAESPFTPIEPLAPVEPLAPLKKFGAPAAPARAIPEPTASGPASRVVPKPPTFDEFSKTLEESMMRELGIDEDIS